MRGQSPLKGLQKRFESNDDVKKSVISWLRQQKTDFYYSGIEKLISRYDKCLNKFGDYVEK